MFGEMPLSFNSCLRFNVNLQHSGKTSNFSNHLTLPYYTETGSSHNLTYNRVHNFCYCIKKIHLLLLRMRLSEAEISNILKLFKTSLRNWMFCLQVSHSICGQDRGVSLKACKVIGVLAASWLLSCKCTKTNI